MTLVERALPVPRGGPLYRTCGGQGVENMQSASSPVQSAKCKVKSTSRIAQMQTAQCKVLKEGEVHTRGRLEPILESL